MPSVIQVHDEKSLGTNLSPHAEPVPSILIVLISSIVMVAVKEYMLYIYVYKVAMNERAE